jgi:uncharacterized repeat protein (TIGR04138 family)
MICDQCKQREVRVFLTQIVGDTVIKAQLCDECARERPELATELNSVELGGYAHRRGGFEEFLGNVTRHPREAYEFVCEALTFWTSLHSEAPGNLKMIHASGKELLLVIHHLAREKFGKEAKAVLGGWKIYRTEDFGEIVFDLVNAHLLLKRPEDSKEDFQNGYSFDEAFPED